MNTYYKLMTFIIVVLNLYSWELCCSANSNNSPNIAIESEKKSQQEMLLDQSVPDAKKIGILYRDGLDSKAVVSGSVLTNLITTSSNESLKAVALFKLGHLKECSFASTFLIDFAKDNSNSDNTRWVAIEDLAFFTNRNVSEALLSFATNRDMELSFRIRALSSLMKCQPTLYEAVWGQIKLSEADFASVAQESLYPKRRSPVVLDTATEETLRNKLEKQEGEDARHTIQKLSNGKTEDTIRTLIKRYHSESDDNKAEIALSLAKIAKREKSQFNRVKGFLVASKENEKSDILKHCIQEFINFLNDDKR